MINDKIGIAVITCNREDTFRKCLQSLPIVDHIVVVNDGSPYPQDAYDSLRKYPSSQLIQHPRNTSVATSKNDGLRSMIAAGCTHLFLCEDDIEVLDPNVCNRYIEAAAASGIWHLNYALSSKINRDKDGKPKPVQQIDYDERNTISFYEHIVGSWSYFHASVIKHIGLFDERYINAMEHVEHTYRAILQQLHPPYWWFADVADSDKLLADQDIDLTNSVIRKSLNWEHNFRHACLLFMHKHGMLPTAVAKTEPQAALEQIEKLHTYYKRDDIKQFYANLRS